MKNIEINTLETLSIKLLQPDGCDNKEYEAIIDTLEKMSRQETTCRYKEGFSNGKLVKKLIEIGNNNKSNTKLLGNILKTGKKILLIGMLLWLCNAIGAQQIVEWSDLLTETNAAHCTVHYKKNGHEALHGAFRIKRGLDEECIKFSHGVMDGEYRRYRDGALREAGTYDKGLRNGTFFEYYQDGKTVRKETPMRQGKIEGMVKTYYRDGTVESEKEYQQSVEHGRARRFDNKTGELILEAHYVDGQKEGKEMIVEDHGHGMRSKTVRHYSNGRLNGSFRMESTQDGQPYITVEGQYADGRKSGHWKQYNATNGKTSEQDEK